MGWPRVVLGVTAEELNKHLRLTEQTKVVALDAKTIAMGAKTLWLAMKAEIQARLEPPSEPVRYLVAVTASELPPDEAPPAPVPQHSDQLAA